MMRNLHTKLLFDSLLDFHEPWIAIFQHLSGVKINEVVMLPKFIGMFELGAVMAELVLEETGIDFMKPECVF